MSTESKPSTHKMGILLSASQLKTALDCRRKWGIAYIDGIKQPATDAMKEGTELHAVAEAWLRDGTAPDLKTRAGKLFSKGLKFLPLPSDELEVEGAFQFEDGDLAWRGFADLIALGSPARVTDHKTTKSFRWAMSPGELREDAQAILYAKYLTDREELDGVEVQWIYYLKGKRPDARETIAYLDREEINDRFEGLREIGRELLKLKQTKNSGLDIPVEAFPHAGCSSYGGCPHFEICHKLQNKEETMTSLLERLKQTAQISEEATKAPAPAVAEVAPRAVVAVEAPAPKAVPEVGINPPTSPDPKAIDVPKPRRGRPPGAKNKAPAKAKDPAKAPVIDEVGELREIPECMTDPETGTAYTLYIDCVPGSGAGNLDDTLRDATINAADGGGVDHYRLIKFGEGPATLCVELRKLLKARVLDSNLPERVVVNSANQCIQDALPELEAFAVETVRALR